jgi:hypothetical protein
MGNGNKEENRWIGGTYTGHMMIIYNYGLHPFIIPTAVHQQMERWILTCGVNRLISHIFASKDLLLQKFLD